MTEDARAAAVAAGTLRDDHERTSAARRLLSAVGAAPLEHVAWLARQALGTPSAQVSVLSDVRTVAAAAGTATEPVGETAALDDVVCTVTATGAVPLVVADARDDVRLRDLPSVADGRIRSYLGVPLVDADGHVLGALCVYGSRVRSWTPEEVQGLCDLATTTTATLEAAAGAATEAARRYALLAAVTDDLASAPDVQEAVSRLTRRLVPALGTWCVITVVDDRGDHRDVASRHADPGLRPLVARYAALRQADLSPGAPFHQALRSGIPVVVPGAAAAAGQTRSGEARAALEQLGPRVACILPMRSLRGPVGAISLFLDDGDPDLTADELSTLAELADRAGQLLVSTRRHDRHREIAETLQRSLLTPPVPPHGARIAARYVAAAEAAQVGGDWYDAFHQDEHRCVLVIGDVMGHDTLAAAQMSQVRTLLRGIALTTGTGPVEILRQLDATLADLRSPTIATAAVVRLEPTRDGTGATDVQWASAGHLPPVVVAPDGTASDLPGTRPGLVLGVDPGARRRERRVRVPRGSVLLLFTDGLVERRGEDLHAGLQRLRDLLADLARAAGGAGRVDPDRLLDDVLAGMVPGGTGDDDIALLAVAL
jgi:GAF domain-containing protein